MRFRAIVTTALKALVHLAGNGSHHVSARVLQQCLPEHQICLRKISAFANPPFSETLDVLPTIWHRGSYIVEHMF
jgi:hypothetical protein